MGKIFFNNLDAHSLQSDSVSTTQIKDQQINFQVQIEIQRMYTSQTPLIDNKAEQ